MRQIKHRLILDGDITKKINELSEALDGFFVVLDRAKLKQPNKESIKKLIKMSIVMLSDECLDIVYKKAKDRPLPK